jgi:hypothetical protein
VLALLLVLDPVSGEAITSTITSTVTSGKQKI